MIPLSWYLFPNIKSRPFFSKSLFFLHPLSSFHFLFFSNLIVFFYTVKIEFLFLVRTNIKFLIITSWKFQFCSNLKTTIDWFAQFHLILSVAKDVSCLYKYKLFNIIVTKIFQWYVISPWWNRYFHFTVSSHPKQYLYLSVWFVFVENACISINNSENFRHELKLCPYFCQSIPRFWFVKNLEIEYG